VIVALVFEQEVDQRGTEGGFNFEEEVGVALAQG
jgi:hypothetical protein